MKLNTFVMMLIYISLVFVAGLIGIIKLDLHPLWTVIYIIAYPTVILFCLHLMNERLKKKR